MRIKSLGKEVVMAFALDALHVGLFVDSLHGLSGGTIAVLLSVRCLVFII
jgi:hypothetical protein